MIDTTKYIFVTGGVVSSLGKGLTSAAIGALLEAQGFRVRIQKFDPYLNVDPGTMSPYQHGEVYVLNDGAETDLDLGHYERFTTCHFDKTNSVSSGQIYYQVITNERQGVYLGKTVQIIPHISDEIKRRFVTGTGDAEIVITEIGGTVGDIEGLSFLEAIRQFCQEHGQANTLCIHMTLVPYLRAAGEYKTKASQMSVAKLREVGIQPKILITRSEESIGADQVEKLKFYCNVEQVIEEVDMQTSIYEIPLYLKHERLDEVILKSLSLPFNHSNTLERFQKIMDTINGECRFVKIGFVGKYLENADAYKSVVEAMNHACIHHKLKLQLVKIDAENFESQDQQVKDDAFEKLKSVQGILVPGGFGSRGTEGMIAAAKFARENDVPYFGICLGMQVAVIEFARNICELNGANSTEFDEKAPFPVIDLMEGQKNLQKGASMRLGSYECQLVKNTLAAKLYGGDKIVNERHRHRFEFNGKYLEQMEKAGLVVSGINPQSKLVEMVEIPSHPFYIGLQSHPEFLSKVFCPHPVFAGFIDAADKKKAK